MGSPHPATPLIRAMVEQGFDDATIAATVAMLGLSISRTTISRLRYGRRSDGTLRPGERRLDEPIRCPGCRARINVSPCRACSGMMKRE